MATFLGAADQHSELQQAHRSWLLWSHHEGLVHRAHPSFLLGKPDANHLLQEASAILSKKWLQGESQATQGLDTPNGGSANFPAVVEAAPAPLLSSRP